MLRQNWTGTTSTDLVSFVTYVHKRLEDATAAATEMEATAKSSIKTYYNRGAKSQVFEIGDLVLFLKPSTKVKFNAQWQGPYSVEDRLSDTTYSVRKLRHG